MNEELLAASALQYKFKVAPYRSVIIVYKLFLQLSNVKPQNQLRLRPLLRPRFNQMAKRARRVS
jgi:hypothetical protein